MTETQALQLFKCLGDKSRLQILKSLAQEDMYVERLAERMGLSAPTVSFHLKKLAEAGAVRMYKNQYYTMYALCRDVFEARMIDIIGEEFPYLLQVPADETPIDMEAVLAFHDRCYRGKSRTEVGQEIRRYIEARSGMKQTFAAVVRRFED